jgi:hypothetical protein
MVHVISHWKGGGKKLLKIGPREGRGEVYIFS